MSFLVNRPTRAAISLMVISLQTPTSITLTHVLSRRAIRGDQQRLSSVTLIQTSFRTVVNGGSAVALAQPNRITRPGVRFNGSNTSATLAARNNVFKSGSAGVGGVSQMGILNTTAKMSAQAQPQYWDNYQLGNGEAIPVVEGGSFFEWSANGGLGQGSSKSPVAITAQTLVAATQTLLTGSLLAIPPQGWQVGTVIRWTIRMTKSAAGAAIPGTFLILVNTTGTSAGAGTVATMALTSVGTAAADTATVIIDFTVRSLGAAAVGVPISCSRTVCKQQAGWLYRCKKSTQRWPRGTARLRNSSL